MVSVCQRLKSPTVDRATHRTYLTHMSSLAFASAYRSLRPGERAYVDGYVAEQEARAIKRNERISLALNRQLTASEIQASNGMLDKPMVRAAIVERINQLAADQELSPQRVIKELMCMAFSSIADYGEIGQDGELWLQMDKCTPEQMRAVKKIKIDENGRGGRKTELELYPKLEPLMALAKYMGLQEDNPHWRAESAKPVQAVLPAGVGVDAAADAYARSLANDG